MYTNGVDWVNFSVRPTLQMESSWGRYKCKGLFCGCLRSSKDAGLFSVLFFQKTNSKDPGRKYTFPRSERQMEHTEVSVSVLRNFRLFVGHLPWEALTKICFSFR